MHKWINYSLHSGVVCEICKIKGFKATDGSIVIFNMINGFKPNVAIVYRNEDITCDEFIIKNIIE